MRTFLAYMLYFRGDPFLQDLVKAIEEDTNIPSDSEDHDVLYDYFMTNSVYEEYQDHVHSFYQKYITYLDVSIRR